MERLYALHLLYKVEEASRGHGHKVINAWCHKEIAEHQAALGEGEHTQPQPAEAEDE